MIFEPDPREIERRLRDEDALNVLVIDDDRIPTATRFASALLENAAGGSTPAALKAAAERWAAQADRDPPDIVYVPALTSQAQVQLAIALAERGIRVVVGASREAFLRLAADPTLHARLWA